MAKSGLSFERYLTQRYMLLAGVSVLLAALVIYLAELDFLEGFTLLLCTAVPCAYWSWQAYSETQDVLDRVGLQMDALGNGEFTTWHLARFERGKVNALKQDAARLAAKMVAARDAYAQQEAVLLSVIEQLAVPVLIVDAHQRVYSANQAMSELLGTSHMQLTGRFASEFGLQRESDRWAFRPEAPLSHAYRIFANHILRGQRRLDILLCFSVERTLRENEKQVWQRLLRVLNHEVRNSLTPISSIAQSLQQMPVTEDNRQQSDALLQVIEQRAQKLLSFVDGYSAFNRIQTPNHKAISAQKLIQGLEAMFPRVKASVVDKTPLYADEGQLEQALINVIKNAVEADSSARDIEVRIEGDARNHFIRVLDGGPGITNPENLFVPFYSTKEGGNGIGLVLSRELLRQLGGDLTLSSRSEGQGAEALLTLPKNELAEALSPHNQ